MYTTINKYDHDWARGIYTMCKSIYHPVALLKVEKILGISGGVRETLSERSVECLESIKLRH